MNQRWWPCYLGRGKYAGACDCKRGVVWKRHMCDMAYDFKWGQTRGAAYSKTWRTPDELSKSPRHPA